MNYVEERIPERDMAENLQEKVDKLETRTDSLENILGRFISSVNRTMVRLETDTLNFRQEIKEFKDEVRADTKNLKDEMRDFKDEIRADTQKFKDEIRADTQKFKDEIRADTQKFKHEIRADTQKLKDEMKEFKDEMKEFKDNTDSILTRMEAETKALKKGLREEAGRLDNKMGTLVENMVAPSIPGIAKTYFSDREFSFFAVRVWKKRIGRPGEGREFDVVAVSENNFYVNETKSSPKPEYVNKFAKVLEDLPDYFPECLDKKIIPVFSSLHIPENVTLHLTRHGIYAMGLKEDTMELLNFDEVKHNA